MILVNSNSRYKTECTRCGMRRVTVRVTVVPPAGASAKERWCFECVGRVQVENTGRVQG